MADREIAAVPQEVSFVPATLFQAPECAFTLISAYANLPNSQPPFFPIFREHRCTKVHLKVTVVLALISEKGCHNFPLGLVFAMVVVLCAVPCHSSLPLLEFRIKTNKQTNNKQMPAQPNPVPNTSN